MSRGVGRASSSVGTPPLCCSVSRPPGGVTAPATVPTAATNTTAVSSSPLCGNGHAVGQRRAGPLEVPPFVDSAREVCACCLPTADASAASSSVDSKNESAFGSGCYGRRFKNSKVICLLPIPCDRPAALFCSGVNSPPSVSPGSEGWSFFLLHSVP